MSKKVLNDLAPVAPHAVDAGHCCDTMRLNVENTCKEHPNRYDCPDLLISYVPVFDEYGIIVHDGGHSAILISYCPWCGTKLRPSQRNRWFEKMEILGIDTGDDATMPEKFKSEAWWRETED